MVEQNSELNTEHSAIIGLYIFDQEQVNEGEVLC